MRQFTFYELPPPYCAFSKKSVQYYLRQFHLVIDDVSNVLNDKAQNRSVVPQSSKLPLK